MIELHLVGVGVGDPKHLTLQAIERLAAADLLLLPDKGEDKADLLALRRRILAQLPSAPREVAPFVMPERDPASPYFEAVERWHDAIAARWRAAIAERLPAGGSKIALMIWGDPSLYDSALRIAERLKHDGMALRVVVTPGITSLQLLTAAHGIALTPLGDAAIVTTGRRLRERGWPDGARAVAVMLDGACAFGALDPAGLTIYWGAYLGMAKELLRAGPLEEIGPSIAALRARARAEHGWIMDAYLLTREP